MILFDKYRTEIKTIIKIYLKTIGADFNHFNCGDGDFMSDNSGHKYIDIKKLNSDEYSHFLIINKPLCIDAYSSISVPINIAKEESGEIHLKIFNNETSINDSESLSNVLLSLNEKI